jgi:hypothetical protein
VGKKRPWFCHESEKLGRLWLQIFCRLWLNAPAFAPLERGFSANGRGGTI